MITIIVPIGTSDDFSPKSTDPPELKRKWTHFLNYGRKQSWSSCQRGLRVENALLNDKLGILVTRLDDLVLEGRRGTLRMSVPYKDLKFEASPQTTEVEMDGATGRVLVWGWDKDACETKIFVVDLV